jgi:crotonobetainyl-CoA:carnitine CoA-transferase CaiB-like acyl-CoA transferase
VKNESQLTEEIESWTGALPVSTVVEMLAKAGVPSAPVRDPKTAIRDPRVVARSETVPVNHPVLGTFEQYRTAGIPVHFSDAIVGNSGPAPRLGEHTTEILSSIAGYSSEQIAALRQARVI